MVSYKRNVGYNLSCPLQTCCLLSIVEKQFVSGQFFQTYGVVSCGRGWRKDVVNQCLGFDTVRHWLKDSDSVCTCNTAHASRVGQCSSACTPILQHVIVFTVYQVQNMQTVQTESFI